GRKLGLIELADGGTLFLDEVTELPAQLQAKLLRAIETRTFFRVGGVRKVEVNVRIVAATNRNLESVVSNESFRSDLLYRINGFQIDLAPLRERPEDIEPLARHLLSDVGGTSSFELEPGTLDALRAYSWPGNVRQLKNCLERAVILSNNGRITIAELPPEVLRPPVPAAAFTSPASQPAAAVDFNAGASSFASTAGSPGSLRDVERQQILAALEQTGWHRGKTAEILGISPSTLYRRLRDYNLERRNG
ncbi:MAG: sigma 54-interacting transcriptional regulator, partial [Pyrinomonadaceae bacterium]